MVSNHQEATPPETNGDDSLSPIPCPQQMGVTLECSAPPPKSTTGGVGVVPVPAPVSAKTRSKSVTFDISNNKEYEASPLLTPKYEDEDDEDDFGEFASKSSSSEIMSEHDVNNSGREMTICDDLNRNSDYSALCATLEMLHNKESQIHSEMTQLTNLKATLEHMNKSSLISFYLRLLQGQVHLPTPSKIPKAPVVQWGKYGLSDKVGDCLKGTMNLKEQMDQGLKVFNSPSNDQFSFENFKF
ncbi:uncharacterized protein KQ657_002625 [Scheffersomyces spartinae]|uniref:Uncharacterized protein n=1 Tax=Scheffersomyces spartinae TaxID=45513 RepID=A0A9P7V6G6_9ASCO|nr:uncharacterized protein KQ657_002625 [Scheffersomyces spartinae]KAG7192017.1 hypothetical protein KQ657_002625 [Scheffersomyces spartinae]